jgi:DNA-directed RNA polymerase III subunit RPC8
LGEFFDDIFIPAYWMLRPSHFEHDKKIWVWTPQYGDDDGEKSENQPGDATKIKNELESDDNVEIQGEVDPNVDGGDEGNGEDENRFEMEIGAEIRFRVKSINFTQVRMRRGH